MSFIKTYPIAILLFSAFVIGFYANLGGSNGFWSRYGYTPTEGNLTAYDKIDSMSTFGKDLSCDVNPESESCPDLQSNLIADTFIGRMVQRAYGGLVTIIKLFYVPLDLVNELGRDIGIPEVFITVIYTLLLIIMAISLILLIFNRSDEA